MIRRLSRIARRIVLAIGWLAVVVALAVGGAGILAQMAHPPGTAARAELTWAGDVSLRPRLDDARRDLATVAAKVDDLAGLGRTALTAVRSSDATALESAVTAGSSDAQAIDAESAALRTRLRDMPGDRPTDVLAVDTALLGRRSAMLAAVDAASGLSQRWQDLSSRSLTAVKLVTLLTAHDTTVANAAAQGRAGSYDAALTILGTAVGDLDAASTLRDQLKPTTDVSILDQWLERNRTYDAALTTLYTTLRDAKGKITDAVKAAYRAEATARTQLPPDTRGLVVIIGDIARGGLNQAVIAIEQARGRIDLALQTLAMPGG